MAEREINVGKLAQDYINIRIAFAGLILVADKNGCFEWKPEEIRAEVMPYEKVDFGKALEVLAATGNPPFIRRFQINGQIYGVLNAFPKYQRPHSLERESDLPKPPPIGEKPPEPPKPARSPRQPRKDNDAKPREVALGPTPKDSPAQSLVWYLAQISGLTFRNGAEVSQYFSRQIGPAKRVVELASGDLEFAKKGIGQIWAWLNKEAQKGEISAPENMQAVVNNWVAWRNEYEGTKKNQTWSAEEF